MADQEIESSDIRNLIDKQEITEVLGRFSRAVDRQDLELLATVYHEGATDDHGAFSGPAEDFIDWVRRGWATGLLASSNHVVTNVLVELGPGPDSASVESYFFAHHTWKAKDGALDDFLGGRYLDRFERRNGMWGILSRRCVWDWGRTSPATEETWLTRVPGDYTFGVPARSDASYLLLEHGPIDQ
jgi:hypothetical protein